MILRSVLESVATTRTLYCKLLAQMAERGLQFPVTLVTAAGMVSGRVTSTRSYFEKFGDAWDKGWPGGVAGFKEVWTQFAVGPEKADEDQDDTFDKAAHAKYIHLEDVSVFNGGLHPFTGSEPFRIRITEVIGFTLGMYQSR